MPTYKFKVKVDNREKVKRQLDAAIEKTLNEIGDAAVKHAHDYAPVDTGRLQDSYIKDVDAKARILRVGSPLPWSSFVELGTGPFYHKPPDWITNYEPRGHHPNTAAPWWYMDEYTGEWTMGWFIRAQPHLRPAFMKHIKEYKDIFRKNLQNAGR